MPLYISALNRVIPSSPPPSGASITNTKVNQTPTSNTLVTSGNVADATPISGSDVVRYTFDYVTEGVGTGNSVTISGTYGTAISVPDGTDVFTNTGILLTSGDTYGSLRYEHPVSPNWDNSGSTQSGVTQDEGVVKKVEIRVEVLEGGVTVVDDETLWSSYMQFTMDNGTTDTNNAFEGSIRTPAGDAFAWTNFPDLGGVRESYTFTPNGQLPSNRCTEYVSTPLGSTAGYNYGAWAVANTNWTVPRGEYRKNTHGWDNAGSGNIYFMLNGVRTAYPNSYSTQGNLADTEWRNFIEWAFETIDGVPTLPMQDYVQKVEIQSFSNTADHRDRLGNAGVASDHVLYHHRFGEIGNENDSTWGGWATTCWTDAKNHVNASGTALPATPPIGNMYVQSVSGDVIEFVPRRYFR